MTGRPIDLRSDTVTRPSAAMRRAIADAEVGDDVLDRDPTTRRLEERVAELLGKDDALFFPSGTQANQTAVGLLARPGSELLLEADAHLVQYDLGGVAAIFLHFPGRADIEDPPTGNRHSLGVARRRLRLETAALRFARPDLPVHQK